MAETRLVIDQRDIQRRGGFCVQYPVSCMLEDLARELFGNPVGPIVVDVTYGEGRFYGVWRPRILVACDIKRYKWVTQPDVFIKTPSWSAWGKVARLRLPRVDMVVVDPPWQENIGGGGREPYSRRIAKGTPRSIIYGAFVSAEALNARYVLVHYKNLYYTLGWEPVIVVEWIYVSRHLKNELCNPRKTFFYILRRTP